MQYTLFFDRLKPEDYNSNNAKVGPKIGSLGNLITNLEKEKILVPFGFAITSDAFNSFIKDNNLEKDIIDLQNLLDKYNNFNKNLKPLESETSLGLEHLKLNHLTQDNLNLKKIILKESKKIKSLILKSQINLDLEKEIKSSYQKLSELYKTKDLSVAVRPSVIYKDKNIRFLGQQETYINIQGEEQIELAYKNCIASLFSENILIYILKNRISLLDLSLSVAIQKMVRSDLACSGVIFTADLENSFKDNIIINSSYGLGSAIVHGIINPDEFHVFKVTLEKDFKPIIKKICGTKEKKLIYASNRLDKNKIKKIDNKTKLIRVNKNLSNIFSLSEKEILELARQALKIEKLYIDQNKKNKQNNYWNPLAIEWAKDGIDSNFYILEVDTLKFSEKANQIISYKFIKEPKEKDLIVTGSATQNIIISGKAKIAKSLEDARSVKSNEILIIDNAKPDWLPLVKQAKAIVTNQGGRTSHIAIESREFNLPAIIGTQNGTKLIKNGETITLDFSGSIGKIYSGDLKFEKQITKLNNLPKPPVNLLQNISNPQDAYKSIGLPISGVGLMRLEFVLSNNIQVHPMAIARFKEIPQKLQKKILEKTFAYNNDPKEFFISILSQAIGSIAAVYYPKPVNIRFTDIKSDEYKDLIGSDLFEPKESNPMLGFRGAVRYISPNYRPAFEELEIGAIKHVRDIMGFKNVNLMIPFVRTISETKEVLEILDKHNLKRSKDLKIYLMCEVPSVVILLEEFAKLVDGFSIGSNDLTQLILGADRNSPLISNKYTAQNLAVKLALEDIVKRSRIIKKEISICGQAPADYPDIAELLIKTKIDNISLDIGYVLDFLKLHKALAL